MIEEFTIQLSGLAEDMPKMSKKMDIRNLVEWSKVIKKCLEWSKLVRSGQEMSTGVQSGQKCSTLYQIKSHLTKLDCIGPNWTTMHKFEDIVPNWTKGPNWFLKGSLKHLSVHNDLLNGVHLLCLQNFTVCKKDF